MTETLLREIVTMTALCGWTYVFTAIMFGDVHVSRREFITLVLVLLMTLSLTVGALYPLFLPLEVTRTFGDIVRVALLVGVVGYIRSIRRRVLS